MIKPISDKLRKRKYVYKKLRADFIAKHPWCAWGLKQNPPRKIPSTQIHHRWGRIGRLLNYVPGWVAVSAEGHDDINRYPDRARGLGLLCQKGQYNSYDAAVRSCEG
jgi:hypothetical protein